jgi:aryl-alcohol dehydrogenase-like predicted oxidoreductase
MSYGIANTKGQASPAEVARLLDLAKDQGIRLIDTAKAYGTAETVLGAQRAAERGFRIVTKTLPTRSLSFGDEEIARITGAFGESLQSLNTDHVYALLVHRPEELLSRGGGRLWSALQALKERGQVRKVGVSAYDPEQLKGILPRYSIDIVQIPFNLYDQRFKRSGMLNRLKESGIEVHARSAFLQGLLLMRPEALPAHFESIRSHHARLHQRIEQSKSSALEVSLAFCLGQPEIDVVVVGCETADQLSEILFRSDLLPSDFLGSFAPFNVDDPDIVLPPNWPKSS